METGRWADIKTVGPYINEASVELASFRTHQALAEFLHLSSRNLQLLLQG